MAVGNEVDQELIRGLEALVATTFPKRCRCCNRSFVDVADYVMQTEAMPGGARSIKQSLDDDGKVIIDLFRNCPCGSTLMDSFNNRRDTTAQGEARRQRFDELMSYLIDHGLAARTARLELIKFMNGETSEILSAIGPPPSRK